MFERRSNRSVRDNLIRIFALAGLLVVTATAAGFAFLATKNPWAIVLSAVLIFILAAAVFYFWWSFLFAMWPEWGGQREGSKNHDEEKLPK